jgi:NAD(P)-dependent dehydrogenase (short-subunit alcohol dehydrogenase family)
MSKWRGKAVVVTSGASGIRLSIARAFAGTGSIADLHHGRIDGVIERLGD